MIVCMCVCGGVVASDSEQSYDNIGLIVIFLKQKVRVSCIS